MAIARGRSYFVSALMHHEGPQFSVAASYPVVRVLPIPHAGLLILSDLSTIAAFDERGQRWRTRVSYDEVDQLLADDSMLVGRAWDPTIGAFGEFRIRLDDGGYISQSPTF